jgi:predicted nucleic acid-binding protein
VTVTEIQRGIERARAQHPAAAEDAERWLTGMLAVGEPQVVPMNVQAARLLGRMYETPALRHFVVTDPKAKDPATGSDLAIAAIAIAEKATVATNNSFFRSTTCSRCSGYSTLSIRHGTCNRLLRPGKSTPKNECFISWPRPNRHGPACCLDRGHP